VEHIDFLMDFVVGNSKKLQNLGEPSMCSHLGQWHMLHYYILCKHMDNFEINLMNFFLNIKQFQNNVINDFAI
jgi:hypothetical protein